MSDTPRTDEAEFVIQGDHVVYADFARQLEQENAELRSKIEEIERLCAAYPLKNFPEPDMTRAAKLLKSGGITLDTISASNMRHVLKEVLAITSGRNGD